MTSLRTRLLDLLHDEEGATTVEYAVMAVLIIAVAVVTIFVLGAKVENLYNQTDAVFGGAVNNS